MTGSERTEVHEINQRLDRDVHEINQRLDRIMSWALWIRGIAVTACFGLVAAWIGLEGRVSSLEASRDSTVKAIERIDVKLDQIIGHLIGSP